VRSNSRLRLARRPRRWQQPACAWGGDGRPSHPHLRGHGVHVRGPRPEPHGRCIHHAGLERVDLGWSSFFPARRTEAPCRTTTSRRSTSTTECTTSPQVHTTPRPRAGHMGRSHSAVTPTPIRVRRARRTRPAVSATRARAHGRFFTWRGQWYHVWCEFVDQNNQGVPRAKGIYHRWRDSWMT
jgi:hypothetical protein